MADWFRKLFSTRATACSENNIRKVPKHDEHYATSTVIDDDGQINLISSSYNDCNDNVDDHDGKEYVFNHAGEAQQEEKVEEAKSLNDNNTILQEINFLIEEDTNNGNEREGILLQGTPVESDLEKVVNFHTNEMETELNEASQENAEDITNNIQEGIMEQNNHSNTNLRTEKMEELNKSIIEQEVTTNNISQEDDDETNSNNILTDNNTRNCNSNSVAIEVPLPIRIRLKSILSLILIPLWIAIFYAYVRLEENQRELNFCLFGSFILGFIAILHTMTRKCERSTEPQILNQVHEMDVEPNSSLEGWVMFD